MPKGEPRRLETLEALLAEKRKHEGYLAKLEQRRAGTPEHVFLKLRDEYLTKLTDAQVRAAAEAEALGGGLDEDEAAVHEAEERLTKLTEEKVEAELRAEVEEWDPKEWQKKLTQMNAAISVAEKERDARKTVFERTRALLLEARGGEGDAPAAAPVEESASAPMPTKPRPTTAMSGGPNFDELAFLNSVVPRTSGVTPTPRVSRPVERQPTPTAPTPAPPSKASAQSDLPLESPSAEAVRRAVEAPSAEPPSAKPPASTESEPLREPTSAKPPAPKAEEPKEASSAPAPAKESPAAEDEDSEGPSSPLGRPTPRTSQAIKTLKCAECGSMNYPTEWYCERCGGELAAL